MKLIYKSSKLFADPNRISARIAELGARLRQQQLNARTWWSEHQSEENADLKVAVMNAEANVTRSEIEVQKLKLRQAKDLESAYNRLQYVKDQLKDAKDKLKS